jgi:hypothetical protein
MVIGSLAESVGRDDLPGFHTGGVPANLMIETGRPTIRAEIPAR